MGRRSTSWNLSLLLVVTAAAVGLSCNSGLDGGGVTGPTAVSPAPSGDDVDLFDASDREDQKSLCHKGRTLSVAATAVPAHLAHGDTLGPCGDPCPCFTANQVAAVAQCPGAQTQCFSWDGTYICSIVCDGRVSSFSVTPDSCAGPGTTSVVDVAQHDQCFGIIVEHCGAWDQ